MSAVTQLPLPSLIRAAAWDAGNQSMQRSNRTKWSRKDFNAAAEFQNRTVAACYGEGPIGCIRFGMAEQFERMGILKLGMSYRKFVEAFNAAALQTEAA